MSRHTVSRWVLTDPERRDAVQNLCPTAPLPWGVAEDKPWCIVDANGADVVITARPNDTLRSMQTLGVIISAVNTLAGYVTERKADG